MCETGGFSPVGMAEELSKFDLKNASVSSCPFIQQPPFPCNDPPLFVIPSEAEGSAVRHSCARPLPARNLHQSSPNTHGSTNLPFVFPRFQERSAELQIPPNDKEEGERFQWELV